MLALGGVGRGRLQHTAAMAFPGLEVETWTSLHLDLMPELFKPPQLSSGKSGS